MLAIHNATASHRLTTTVRSALKMWYAEPLQLDVEAGRFAAVTTTRYISSGCITRLAVDTITYTPHVQ